MLAVAGFGVTALGCAAQGQASARAETSGSLDITASASGSAEATATGDLRGRIQIQFREGRLEYEGGVIDFEYDQATLKGERTERTLVSLQQYLQEHPDVALEIEGHTDSRGEKAYNRDLSRRRAEAIHKWLHDNGIAADRLTFEGYGEERPKVDEGETCRNKVPADSTECEGSEQKPGPWAVNRRAVFRVTKGAETLEEEPQPSVQRAEPTAPPAALAEEGCPPLLGFHLNALGPNALVGAAFAVQPICPLELSLGVGYKLRKIDADASVETTDVEADYSVLTFPLRARVWVMETHSLLFDLGIAYSKYRIDADAEDANGNTMSYSRAGNPFLAIAGVGYGYRSDSAFRLAILVGGVAHINGLNRFDGDTSAAFDPAEADAIAEEMNNESNALTNSAAYVEASFGFLF